MQKGGSLHSHFLVMRTEWLREYGGVSYLKEQTEVCLGPEPCEPVSLSMSQGLRACVSSLRAPRAVWAIVGTARTEEWERHSCFPAPWTLWEVTARSKVLVGLLREKEWWTISLMHCTTPVFMMLMWTKEGKRAEKGHWKNRCNLLPFVPQWSLSEGRYLCYCVISIKLSFQKPMDRCLVGKHLGRWKHSEKEHRTPRCVSLTVRIPSLPDVFHLLKKQLTSVPLTLQYACFKLATHPTEVEIGSAFLEWG